jgi:tetrapyrrole methylase family protein / MazG family protein
MSRLRKHCPWDREQTHRSLLKYLREESAELAAAVRKRDYPNMREELGDVLLQVVFHAEIAREAGRFGIGDVVHDICRKLVRRHPHVFGKKKLRTADEVMKQWNELKAKEKQSKRRS